jgi:hypothetical protein
MKVEKAYNTYGRIGGEGRDGRINRKVTKAETTWQAVPGTMKAGTARIAEQNEMQRRYERTQTRAQSSSSVNKGENTAVVNIPAVHHGATTVRGGVTAGTEGRAVAREPGNASAMKVQNRMSSTPINAVFHHLFFRPLSAAGDM